MTVRLLLLICGMLFSVATLAMGSAEYLPEDAMLDSSIPSPESVLGWEPGDWRVDHGGLVQYMNTLSEQSDRVSIKVIGRTHEQRPLLQLVISSPENQSRLEELRLSHLQAATSGDHSAPLVVWLGYSIHGNEASGSNAAMVVAWYLAASTSDNVEDLLENTIIILDPSLNPDGLNRFSSWSNANHSLNSVSDRNSRVHNEDWPRGRTNHYLFDLNRDWLPLVHPESRARITEFHRWLPHVITDHHETGHDGYFFQPGVPTRQHPLTTTENLDMTRALAKFHAASLDQAGVMFFTEDAYDDFYYGKGSTYPDINGSIGILFEQPSVRGSVIDRESGPLTFAQAIHNHVRTSLSTLEGAQQLSNDLKDYQAGFYATMRNQAEKSDFQAWVIGDDNDPARAQALLDVFRRHHVEFSALAKEVTANGHHFSPGHAWVVPVEQQQFGMAQALLETRTDFVENTFYDVSAWNMALAYNLPYARLSRLPPTGNHVAPEKTAAPQADAVAWIIEWQQLGTPAILQQLLHTGARVRAATRSFSSGNAMGSRSFGEGSLVILPGIQDQDKNEAILVILRKAHDGGVNVYSSNSHLTGSGPNLGTSRFKTLRDVKALLVSGEGTNAYAVGEVWHQMDQRLGVAPVMVGMTRLKQIRLHDYSHLLMANGNYKAIGDELKQRIATWIKDGGILIATQGAATWAETLCFSSGDCSEEHNGDKDNDTAPDNDQTGPMAYGNFEDQRARKTIGGAIVSTTVDPSHPIAYGYGSTLPLFRRGTTLLAASDNPFTTPVRYTQSPLLSGYIGEERLEQISGQAAVIAQRHDQGLVVRFANDPLFRGFWRGTERLWVNSLYLGSMVESTKLPE